MYPRQGVDQFWISVLDESLLIVKDCYIRVLSVSFYSSEGAIARSRFNQNAQRQMAPKP
ncbi:MAG TPA: hypothetical protein V6D04_00160 [Candidatus Obscuribacterales bacterium]